MKLLLCVEETGVMVIFHSEILANQPTTGTKCVAGVLRVVHCVIFSVISLIMHVTVKTVYYILISETALSRGCAGTVLVVVVVVLSSCCPPFPGISPSTSNCFKKTQGD